MLSLLSANTAECEIVNTGIYREIIKLRPIEALPGEFEIRVTSTLSTARNPDEAQIRYRTTVNRDALVRIRQAIEDVLAEQSEKISV
jgi:hypothetical protein